MSKKKDVLNVDVDKVSLSGRPITSGDRSEKFDGWLKSVGLDRERMMEEFMDADNAPDFIQTVKKRALALQASQALVDATKDFYNDNNKRFLALNTQLQEVNTIIQTHVMEQRKMDDTYSEVNDKNLLKWFTLRSDLMEKIRKQQMELTKMSVDKDSVVKSEEVDWDGI